MNFAFPNVFCCGFFCLDFLAETHITMDTIVMAAHSSTTSGTVMAIPTTVLPSRPELVFSGVVCGGMMDGDCVGGVGQGVCSGQMKESTKEKNEVCGSHH